MAGRQDRTLKRNSNKENKNENEKIDVIFLSLPLALRCATRSYCKIITSYPTNHQVKLLIFFGTRIIFASYFQSIVLATGELGDTVSHAKATRRERIRYWQHPGKEAMRNAESQ